MPSPLIEAFVVTPEQASAAEQAGADRIELCGPGDGGLTASPALIEATLRVCSVPVHAMIRPREGGFVYSDAEFAQMRQSLRDAKSAGSHGVVFGVLDQQGKLDLPRMGELVGLARPLRVGCHRAFDATPDADEALEQLLGLGVDIVLTSGHATTALQGCDTLARLVRRASGRLEVLAGGGVRGDHVQALVAATGVTAVHARGEDAAVIAALSTALRR